MTLLRSFWHRTLAGCSFLSGTRRVVSAILAILALSHDIFYCYDIPRYIVTLAILVSSARRQTSNYAWSLLVLCALRRQQRALYVIVAIFER